MKPHNRILLSICPIALIAACANEPNTEPFAQSPDHLANIVTINIPTPTTTLLPLDALPDVTIPDHRTQILTNDYKWAKASATQTEQLQQTLNVTVDGYYGHETLSAHRRELIDLNLPLDHLPTPPSPQTRTLPADKTCPNVEQVAPQVGWPASEIPTLSYVAYRESRCQPQAYNGRNLDRSYGLVQINVKGYLWPDRQTLCGLNNPDELFDTATNLSCALKLWARSGWGPWNM